MLGTGAEDGLDAVERVALPTTMPEGVLLHATADLVDGGGAELDDVERVEHRGGVFELVVDRGSTCTPSSRSAGRISGWRY